MIETATRYGTSPGTILAWRRAEEVRRRYPELTKFSIRTRSDGSLGVIPIEWRSPEEMERRRRPLTREERERRLREIEASL